MITIEQLLKEWLNIYIKPCRSENAYKCYKYIIIMAQRCSPELAYKDIEDLTSMEFQKFINSLSTTYSKSTLQKIRTVFHEAYDVALKNEFCTKNPIVNISIPKEASEKIVRGLTQAEQKVVESAASNDKLGHLIMFLLYTGLRVSELENLKWADYDPVQSVIYIRESKTAAGIRAVPLLPEAQNIIEKQPQICDYIFTSTVYKPLTEIVVRRLIQRIRKYTGLNWLTPHVLRHTFATRLVEKRVDYKALSTLLGHTNIAFTLRCYPSIELNFLKEQISLLNK